MNKAVTKFDKDGNPQQVEISEKTGREIEKRLGTRKFCLAWMQAGENTTNWDAFIKEFRKFAGDPYYPEHLIKARIWKYESQMGPVRGVHPPKYPKERTPVAVMFFKAPEAERERLKKDHPLLAHLAEQSD